jgi:hypothetical protein
MKKIILTLCLSMLLSFVSTNFSTTSSVAFAATSVSAIKTEGKALKGYSAADVQAAEAIALASNNTVATVAAKKTKTNTWKTVQKLFNVSDTAYAKALLQIKTAK